MSFMNLLKYCLKNPLFESQIKNVAASLRRKVITEPKLFMNFPSEDLLIIKEVLEDKRFNESLFMKMALQKILELNKKS